MLPVGEEIETASQSILAVTPHCHMVSLLKICCTQPEGLRCFGAIPVSLLVQIPPWLPLVRPEEIIGFD